VQQPDLAVFDGLREQLQNLAAITRAPRVTSGMRKRATRSIIEFAFQVIDVAESEVRRLSAERAAQDEDAMV
jgi:hypothetical protein